MDFGIAHAASQTRLTMTSSILGTPEYMSPEQADGVQVDNRTDIYSLGIVLYETLTGSVPFKGDNPLSIISHVKQTSPEPPSRENKKIPHWLESILLKTLAKKPEDRIQTAAEFVDLIKNRKVPSKNRSINVRYLNMAAILIILTMGGTLVYHFYPVLSDKIVDFVEQIIGGGEPRDEILVKAQRAYHNNHWVNPEEQSALFYTNQVLKGQPGNKDAKSLKEKMYKECLVKGNEAFESGNYANAGSYYQKAFTIFPGRQSARDDIVENFRDIGNNQFKDLNLDLSIKHYKTGLTLARLGPSSDRTGLLEDKIDKLRALKKHIDNGNEYAQKGAFAKALQAFRGANKIEPGLEPVRNKISQIERIANYVKNGRQALAQNNCKRAIAIFQKAKNLDPDNPYLINRFNEARNCFSVGLDMVYVKGGSFQMGCQNQQEECEADEKPVHKANLGSFYISKHEVTNKQYCHMLNEQGNPEQGGAKCIDLGDSKILRQSGRFMPQQGFENHPVSGVTWHGARAFCRWLSNKTNRKYRLPSEAEWEYAARGGQQSKSYVYSGSNTPAEVAWFNTNQTHPVGQKASNELGIYDMSGNVAEWCYDRYDNDYYENSPISNPRNASNGKSRVIRGGHWAKGAEECRVASRTSLRPDYSYEIYGFRVCSN